MDTYKISFRKLINNSLARNSAVVFAGSMASNVLAYVYHLFMGRLLGPSGYGELASLLSLLYVFTVPILVAQTVLIKFISGFKARGETGQTKTLFLQSTKLFIVISVVLFPVVFMTGPYITAFLHLSNTTLFTLLYFFLISSLLTIATGSVLTGYQKFVWVSVMATLAILIKLLISIPFVRWGVSGVMLAAVLAGIVAYGLYFIPLRFLFKARAKPTELKRRDMLGFAIPTLLTQLGITSLYSMDIIFVRHYFSAYDAGVYAALAILGKIIFYASSAIPTVLFPIASERAAAGTKTKKLILSAVGIVVAISTGITLIYLLFPDLIVRLLFGNAYVGAGGFLGSFGIFLSLFSIGGIIVTACLALGRTGVWFVPIACAILQIIGITVWHGNISTVISLNIGICALYVLGSAAYYLKGTYAKI
jgi:O-antigen/teichoic acid export membrane protein